MKKYELTSESKISFGRKLYRIKALVAFSDVEKGELGGYIEKEENLDQSGNAWVSGAAMVSGDAEVFGNAWVDGDARVSGNAWVFGNAKVFDNAWVDGDARVSGNAWVFGNAKVFDNAWVDGDARVSGNAWVFDNTKVSDNARVSGNAMVSGNAWVSGDAMVYGNAEVFGNAWVSGNAEVFEGTHLLQIGYIGPQNDTTTFFRTKSKAIYVKSGYYEGSITDFEADVEKTHKGTKHEKTYKLAIQLAKEQIELD